MKKKKEAQIAQQKYETELKAAQEEAKYAGMPEWKKKLVKKKASEREEREAIEIEKNSERQAVHDRIAIMPEWKRKLFLEKNPEYKAKD